MRSASVRMKARSGDIFLSSRRKPGPIITAVRGARKPSNSIVEKDRTRRLGPGVRRDNLRSHPSHRHRKLRAVLDGLVDHAIALGEFEQQIEFVLRRWRVDVETQANLGKSDRRLLVDAERAAEIEIALGGDQTRLQRHLDRGPYRLQGHAGTGDQRFQQHVAGAQFKSGTAAGGMQAGDRQGAAGLDLAGDGFVLDRAPGFKRDDRGLRIGFVALLDRSLSGAEFGSVHIALQINWVSDVVKDGSDVTTSYGGATLLALRKPFYLKRLSRAPMRKYRPPRPAARIALPEEREIHHGSAAHRECPVTALARSDIRVTDG